MHWIKATRPDGGTQWLNLAACVSMKRDDDVGPLAGHTLVFFGGIAVTVKDDGALQGHHANALVKETPEELLSLPREMIGPDRFVHKAPKPTVRVEESGVGQQRPAPISPARRKRMS